MALWRCLYSSLIALLFISPPTFSLAQTSATDMQQLVGDWPPANWLLAPPGVEEAFPPYFARGEFSGTIYKPADSSRLWAAHITIIDHRDHETALRMLKNYPYCAEVLIDRHQGRSCGSEGNGLGHQQLAYAAGSFLVEISVLGPLPLEIPELNLQIFD